MKAAPTSGADWNRGSVSVLVSIEHAVSVMTILEMAHTPILTRVPWRVPTIVFLELPDDLEFWSRALDFASKH